jgi:hypothetical protein
MEFPMASVEVLENQLAKLNPWPSADELPESMLEPSEEDRRRLLDRSARTSSAYQTADVRPTVKTMAMVEVMKVPNPS